ncbi:hypothetical protein ppKF707_3784 [Metapseudomonas furukawaii]|uniref:Uncharacterized protein n=1 Tax=Metapseudomonas furukawaii TaxID=1149133 RepID=A0AAD1C0X5_METFU|nr:hypothetical protein ppKF707_3784 [Pseudomonas furukawaii]BAU73569.1 hypothetical protein KF707C_18810 [Pseudomonas furukawaii]
MQQQGVHGGVLLGAHYSGATRVFTQHPEQISTAGLPKASEPSPGAGSRFRWRAPPIGTNFLSSVRAAGPCRLGPKEISDAFTG